MTFSLFSFVMAVAWSSLFMLALYILWGSKHFVMQFGFTAVVLLIVGSLFRLLVPIELPMAYEVYDSRFYPAVYDALSGVVGTAGFTYFQLLAVVWVLGSVAIGVWFVLSYRAACRNLQGQPIDEDSPAYTQFVRMKEELGIEVEIGLAQSAHIDSPLLLGIQVPTVYLPLLEYTTVEYQCVYRHELMHWRNKDVYIKLLVQLFCIIFWWNPLVYIFRRGVAHTLELKCDLAATQNSSLEDKRVYLATIVKTLGASAGLNKQSYLASNAVVEMCATEQLSQRFRFVVSYEHKRKWYYPVLSALAVLAAIALSYLFVIQPENLPQRDVTAPVSAVVQRNV